MLRCFSKFVPACTVPSRPRMCVMLSCRIHFPEGKNNITKFHISIAPKEGAYNGGTFEFDVNVPKRYPFAPPRVSCRTKMFHPNVNWRTGELSLGLLTVETWIPVLSINAIMFQLQVRTHAPTCHSDTLYARMPCRHLPWNELAIRSIN